MERTKYDQDTRRRANVNRAVTEEDDACEDGSGTAVVASVSLFREDKLKDELCPLERIPVSIDGRPASALIDSGTEITVVREDVVRDLSREGAPFIYIKGIFGPVEKCPLINIPIGLIMGGRGDVAHQDVLCAVVPSLIEDVLMPPDMRDMLKGEQENVLMPPDMRDMLKGEQENVPAGVSRGELRELPGRVKRKKGPSEINGTRNQHIDSGRNQYRRGYRFFGRDASRFGHKEDPERNPRYRYSDLGPPRIRFDRRPAERPSHDSGSPGKERPRLLLAPRSKTIELGPPMAEAVAASSIFGEARPVDTAAKEREIEARLARERNAIKDPKEKEPESRVRRFSSGSGMIKRSRRFSNSGPGCAREDVVSHYKLPTPKRGKRETQPYTLPGSQQRGGCNCSIKNDRNASSKNIYWASGERENGYRSDHYHYGPRSSCE